MEDIKEMLTSHENINKKVAHTQGKHKGITAIVANKSQRKRLKEIATTMERRAIWRKIVGPRKSLKRVILPLPIKRMIVMKNRKLKHQSASRKMS